MNNDNKLARIEKLAGEAERMANHYAPRSTHAWFEQNGSELATFLRELKTRIEAEEGGSL